MNNATTNQGNKKMQSGMKLAVGQKVSGTYGGFEFSGVVVGLRHVDALGNVKIGEARIEVDNPKSLVGVFGCADPEGRDFLYLTTCQNFKLEDSRIN